MNARPVSSLTPLLIAILAAPTPACIQAGDTDPMDVFDVDAPAIRWTPASLAFGELPGGAEATDVVTLTNMGTDVLTLSGTGLSDDSSADFLPGDVSAPIALAPGDVVQVQVSYLPTDEGGDEGWLQIDSDDPLHPLVEIPMSGSRTPIPVIALDPPQILFGETDEGETQTAESHICNDGDASLKLGQLAQSGADTFALVDDPSDILLEAGGCVPLSVTYTPTDSSPDLGEIEIPSNDPQEPAAYLLLFGRCS